ncbi:hypothetical protein F4810DRAFT_713919 [Camillea tinctor]|nr:hypothetical protein F4810DRAFT_713919 [Camillea tinctor]
MLVPISILLLAGVPVFARENYAPVFPVGQKRQLMTCEQTYGSGSMQCGGMDSRFCFNPNLGQTCCEQDSGYCEQGTYCAPVAGYCCVEGEDLVTCAKNAGFDLPNSASISMAASAPVTAAPTVNRPVLTVTPFLGPSSVAVALDLPLDADALDCNVSAPTAIPVTAIPVTALAEPVPPVQTPVSNKTISPFIEISAAAKGGQTLLGFTTTACIVLGMWTIIA